MSKIVKIDSLLGKIITNINILNDETEIEFLCEDGINYKMIHFQDCCEKVYLEEIIGNIENLLNSKIELAEEVTNETEEEEFEHTTWTFYKLATNKGYVTFRWYGHSNGYYSEKVDIIEYEKDIDIAKLKASFYC
jgi:hypothetical protein